jgi:uncharacterized membrane protein HdeD (DUF308 family)
MEIRLFKNWWLLTIKGLMAVGFGLFVMVRQYPLVRSSLAVSFGILVVVSGILIITGGFLHKKTNPRWRLWLLEGIIDIIIGAFFIFKPQLAKAFFLFFMAIWAFAMGLLQILTSFRMISYMERWWSMLITGIFSILFAILAFINPFYAKYNLSLIIGVACLIFGLILVYNSRILRNIYL